jgi:hypothetical protein
MAAQSQRRASVRTAGTPAPKTERPSPDLKVARSPDRARRSIGGIGTVLALGLFGVCLALAALHAVLVENQASLDNLLERNQQRYERIDKLQAEIAYLDSPEGLADQAHAAGLVPSAELAILTPVGPGQLPPPEEDPFDLGSSGWPPTAPSARPPEAPEPGKSTG